MPNYYVAKDGSDSNDGKSAALPFKTMKKAGQTATRSGDTVTVFSGTYFQENQTPSKTNPDAGIKPKTGVTWLGINAVLDQENAVTSGFAITNEDDVKIIGFEIKNAGSGITGRGVNWEIAENYIHNTTGGAISINGGPKTSPPSSAWGADGIWIHHNKFWRNCKGNYDARSAVSVLMCAD